MKRALVSAAALLAAPLALSAAGNDAVLLSGKFQADGNRYVSTTACSAYFTAGLKVSADTITLDQDQHRLTCKGHASFDESGITAKSDYMVFNVPYVQRVFFLNPSGIKITSPRAR